MIIDVELEGFKALLEGGTDIGLVSPLNRGLEIIVIK